MKTATMPTRGRPKFVRPAGVHPELGVKLTDPKTGIVVEPYAEQDNGRLHFRLYVVPAVVVSLRERWLCHTCVVVDTCKGDHIAIVQRAVGAGAA